MKYTKQIRISEAANELLEEKAKELEINKAFLLDLIIKNTIKNFSISIEVKANEMPKV